MTLAAFLTAATEFGALVGSARQQTRERKVFVTAFDHRIDAERTGPEELGRTGMPLKKQRHGVFTISKPIDRATPLLHKAHALGAVFTQWDLECYRIPPAGGGPRGVNEENHWTVTLKGARIAAIRTFLANVRVPANAALPEYEEVDWTYDSIQYEWEALTGNPKSPGEVAKTTCPAFAGDFTKQSLDKFAEVVVAAVAKKFGDAAKKEVTDFLKKDGKALLKELTKEN